MVYLKVVKRVGPKTFHHRKYSFMAMAKNDRKVWKTLQQEEII